MVKSIIDGDNILLKQVLDEIMRVGKGRWYSTLMEYLNDVGRVGRGNYDQGQFWSRWGKDRPRVKFLKRIKIYGKN